MTTSLFYLAVDFEANCGAGARQVVPKYRITATMQETMRPAPTVQYAHAVDGFDLAYIIAGEGPPVTTLPFHNAHVEKRWGLGGWSSGLLEWNRVLTSDSRGQGLSTRNLNSDPTLH
jgi:hypothetical protein